MWSSTSNCQYYYIAAQSKPLVKIDFRVDKLKAKLKAFAEKGYYPLNWTVRLLYYHCLKRSHLELTNYLFIKYRIIFFILKIVSALAVS